LASARERGFSIHAIGFSGFIACLLVVLSDNLDYNRYSFDHNSLSPRMLIQPVKACGQGSRYGGGTPRTWPGGIPARPSLSRLAGRLSV